VNRAFALQRGIIDGEARDPERDLACARRTIARCILPPDDVSARLGMITLLEHQREAAARVAAMAWRERGAVLADDVGTGKTFIALAAARRLGTIAVVAPAALRARWREALHASDIEAPVLGLERLARVPPPDLQPGVVIIDESHHLRNPTTQRYAAVAALCRQARVLLLSATPVQNRRDDLAAQLGIFLGSAAWSMSDEERARFVVRRRALDDDAHAPRSPGLPSVDGPHWIRIPEDDLLDRLLALPPPLPPSDGDDGGALLVYALARRWASSRAALMATLRRRLATALALEQALEEGRHPTRRELAAWCIGDGAMQLAFPELSTDTTASTPDRARFLDAVRAQQQAIRDLVAHLRASPDPDAARVDALQRLRAAHPGEIVLAFSEFADTANALGPALAAHGGVAWLTSRGARTVSGIVPREAILAQLAPGGDRAVPTAERVSLLMTTDVSSEGIDLQRASVIVHLDLPWNPARLEQRVGRARRLGSSHDRVTVYALAPPAPSERLVEVERRLRAKILVASAAIGVHGRVLPTLWSDEISSASAAELRGELAHLLRSWLGEAKDPRTAECTEVAPSASRAVARGDAFPIAVVEAPFTGWLAAVEWSALDRSHSRSCDALREMEIALLADIGAGPTDRAADVLRAVRASLGCAIQSDYAAAATPVGTIGANEAIEAIERWCEQRAASAAAGLDTAASGIAPTATGRARARTLARIDAFVESAPRHDRARIAALATAARRTVTSRLSLGSERVLEALLESIPEPETWLRAVAGVVQDPAPSEVEDAATNPTQGMHRPTSRLVALILLRASYQPVAEGPRSAPAASH
jgi:superfamily II DNA or RNA helicase